MKVGDFVQKLEENYDLGFIVEERCIFHPKGTNGEKFIQFKMLWNNGIISEWWSAEYCKQYLKKL